MIPRASTALIARLDSVRAEKRVAEALLGVVLDVLEPFACDYLSAGDYSHLCAVVRAPVKVATEAALTTIVTQLALAVQADPGIEARLDRTQHYGTAQAD